MRADGWYLRREPRRRVLDLWTVVSMLLVLWIVAITAWTLDTTRTGVGRNGDRLEQLERREQEDRWLLCQLADQLGVDSPRVTLPREPCPDR